MSCEKRLYQLEHNKYLHVRCMTCLKMGKTSGVGVNYFVYGKEKKWKRKKIILCLSLASQTVW